MHRFLQGLATLSVHLGDLQQGPSEAERRLSDGVRSARSGELVRGIEDFVGPRYSWEPAPGMHPAGPIVAQLFQGHDGHKPPVVAIWAEAGIDGEVDADGARAYATELRRMADHIDCLAARVDTITAGFEDSGTARSLAAGAA